MYKQYLIQLMLSRGIGDVAIKKILNHVSAYSDNSLESVCRDPEKLFSIIKCRSDTPISVLQNEEKAKRLYAKLLSSGVHIITEADSEYPDHLKKTLGTKCPPVLFAKGNIELLSSSAVGFCGSRNVSQEGIGITTQCAEQLALHNITVISGYAKGTDMAAHISAVLHGGNTVFVLAEGILNAYKKREIQGHLTDKNHVFVSQFLPEAKWNVGNAMKRNTVIIGLSRSMILVESGMRGGTFAAGNQTLELGQPLFVIDYKEPGVSAEANPFFISRGGMSIKQKDGVPALKKVFWAVENLGDGGNPGEQLRLDM